MVKVQGTCTEQAEAHILAAVNSCLPYSNRPDSPFVGLLQQFRYLEKTGYKFYVCEDCNGQFDREDKGYCACYGGLL